MNDDTPDQEDTGQQVRPFSAVLQDLNGGQLADKLALDVQELVAAVRDRSRKGTLTLKLEVAPRKGNIDALNVTARVDLKLPEGEPMEAVFFADENGNLLREDPRQMTIPLRTVARPSPGGDLRRAGQ